MMRQTPLIQQHRANGAKLVDFAGWEMPIQYGVVDEYHTVRSHVGLFDVSHMGRVRIAGTGAVSFLQTVATDDSANSPCLKPSIPWSATRMVASKTTSSLSARSGRVPLVNASNREKILSWLQSQPIQDGTVRLEDRSVELSQVAVQGPKLASYS